MAKRDTTLCLGSRQDGNDADGKRGARGGKDRHGGADDTDNAKKLVRDLADAFNDFGVSHSATVHDALG